MDIQYSYMLFFIRIVGALCLFAVISGCHKQQNQPMQTKDKDLTIQVMRLKNDPSENDVYTYKARLTPQKALLAEKSRNDKEALIYRMDSCFYLQSGPNKIYASLVQPVADGISGSFEYLLQFEKANDEVEQDFIYKDKYLNHKRYSIKLTQDNL